MTAVAEAIQKRVVYKAHTTAVITPGAPPAQASDPANTGGQILRYVSCNANLARSNYRSREKRTDRMVNDMRLGGYTVPFSLTGELSPKTYQDFMAAVCGGTWASAVSKTEADFTSMTISGSGVTATVGGSTWAAQGFRVGHVIRFTNMSVAANNATNTQIVALSGTAATLYPPLTDNTADVAFTVATIGRTTDVPSTATAALFFLEEYYVDQDLADITQQIKLGSMQISMPAEGPVGVSFSGMGRMQQRLASGSSPFFGSPTAATTTTILTSNGGQLMIGASAQAIISSMDLTVSPGVSGAQVAFSPYQAGLFGGTVDVSGSIGGLWTDNTLAGYHDAETEFEMLFLLTTGTTAAADFIAGTMARVKLFNFQKQDAVEGGIPFTANFQALRKDTATGYDVGQIRFQDSQSA
jgi:hypothetical protein